MLQFPSTTPFHMRLKLCNHIIEYNNAGCRSVNNTYDSCQILSQGYESFCPFHPESPNCVEFLHNATNKRPAESGICAGMGGPRPNVTCAKKGDPEKYFLNTDDPVFCKTVEDICDADGFVRPEYPYCTTD